MLANANPAIKPPIAELNPTSGELRNAARPSAHPSENKRSISSDLTSERMSLGKTVRLRKITTTAIINALAIVIRILVAIESVLLKVSLLPVAPDIKIKIMIAGINSI